MPWILISFLPSCVSKATLSATFLYLKPAQVAFNSRLLWRPILVKRALHSSLASLKKGVQQFWHFFFSFLSRVWALFMSLWNMRTMELKSVLYSYAFFIDITGNNAGWKRKRERDGGAYTTPLSCSRRTKWNIYSRGTRGTVFGVHV